MRPLHEVREIRGFFPMKRFIYPTCSIHIQAARLHMKQKFGSWLPIGTYVSALVCVISIYAGAQQRDGQASGPAYSTAGKASKALPDGGPTPRLADGHP